MTLPNMYVFLPHKIGFKTSFVDFLKICIRLQRARIAVHLANMRGNVLTRFGPKNCRVDLVERAKIAVRDPVTPSTPFNPLHTPSYPFNPRLPPSHAVAPIPPCPPVPRFKKANLIYIHLQATT